MQQNHQHFPLYISLSEGFSCIRSTPLTVSELELILYYRILCPISSLRKRPGIQRFQENTQTEF